MTELAKADPSPRGIKSLLGKVAELRRELGIEDVLEQVPARRAVEAFVRQVEEAAQKKAAGPASRFARLSQEETEALGTRAQVLKVTYANRGHSLDQRDYQGPPTYFPDLNECLKKCTWGATYEISQQGATPELRCRNEEHWQEKLAKGREAYWEKHEARVKQEDAEDTALAGLIAASLDHALGRILATVLLSRLEYPFYAPARLREFAYEPQTMLRARAVLGIEAPGGHYSLSGESALEALGKVGDDEANIVAAALLVWRLRVAGGVKAALELMEGAAAPQGDAVDQTSPQAQ